MLVIEFQKKNGWSEWPKKIAKIEKGVKKILDSARSSSFASANQINISEKEATSFSPNYCYYIKVDENVIPEKCIKRIRRYLMWRRYRVYIYPVKNMRSNNYRKDFLNKYDQEIYRCVYCGKKITRNKMQVDHLIPVRAAQISKKAQKLLKKRNCKSVNDIENLVPSCGKCNQTKGSKMGSWYYRGRLGKHEGFWLFVNTLKIIVGTLVLCLFLYIIGSILHVKF